MDVREISIQLSAQADDVASYLLPNGRHRNHEWCVGSIKGEPGESLKVRVSGAKVGVWSDFATEQSGDLVDLWAAVRDRSLADVLPEIKDYLGIWEDLREPEKKYARPKESNVKKLDTTKAEAYLTQDRKLTMDTLQKYRVVADPSDTEIIFPSYWGDELINKKHLKVEREGGKKKTYTEKNAEPCLFGWQAISKNAREIYICEGEIDAMSLYQYGYPALSVPYGAGNHQWLDAEFPRLEQFADVYLCFDADDAGEEGVEELSVRLGKHRCSVVVLPMKDANECLQNDVPQEDIDSCIHAAQPTDPDELKRAREYIGEATDIIYGTNSSTGLNLPWPKTVGNVAFNTSELSLWSGINGHGKSQILGMVALSLIEQGERVLKASLEMKPGRLMARMLRQATAMRQPSPPYINKAAEWFDDSLWIFDLTGSAKTERILEVFTYARKRYGIRQFVVDSMMKCGMADDDYAAQKKFVEDLCDFKNDYDCHVHLVAHPRKGESEASQPGKLDVKGTGTITDLADNVFTVWRNKKKEIEMEKTDTPSEELLSKPDSVMRCHKQRNGEWEGAILLWFDPDSFQYVERQNDRPKRYIGFQGNR